MNVESSVSLDLRTLDNLDVALLPSLNVPGNVEREMWREIIGRGKNPGLINVECWRIAEEYKELEFSDCDAIVILIHNWGILFA